MTRQNIFEILKSKYDIVKEVNKLIDLCNSDLFSVGATYGRAERIFDSFILRHWKQRGSYLSCHEIREDLNINYPIDKKASKDELLITLEYYANILYLISLHLDDIFEKSTLKPTDRYILTLENLNIILEHINYIKKKIPEEEKLILVPNNPAAISVAEISTENTALAIMMYNHNSLKGDLSEKRKLLYQISLEYETLLQKPIQGFEDFFKKTNALLNNLHIRHNNIDKDNKNTIIKLDDKELEKWYDELYQLLLFCVLIKDNLDRKKEVETFLKSIKQKK